MNAVEVREWKGLALLIPSTRRRPAGIRTMSLVSLGACLFTLTSMFSFMSGPMSWDASRVSAAIPSGVGFLGAGLIWKGSVGEGENEVSGRRVAKIDRQR